MIDKLYLHIYTLLYRLIFFSTLLCFQNVVLPVRYVRGDKLLFHIIFRVLLHRN